MAAKSTERPEQISKENLPFIDDFHVGEGLVEFVLNKKRCVQS